MQNYLNYGWSFIPDLSWPHREENLILLGNTEALKQPNQDTNKHQTRHMLQTNTGIQDFWIPLHRLSIQKGEIWDWEFSKCWFTYANETCYNWSQLIFLSRAVIELQLSLNFFKWRSDWFGVEFQFILFKQ